MRADIDHLDDTQVLRLAQYYFAGPLLRDSGDGRWGGIGLEAGTRYHLTTYGIWGFALISSPTWRGVLDAGLRSIDLTFAFTPRIQAREQSQDMQLVLDTPEIPVALKLVKLRRRYDACSRSQRDRRGSV